MKPARASRGNGSGRKKIVMIELYPKMPNIGRFIITPRYGMLAVASALAEKSSYEVVSLFEPYLGTITPEDVAAMEPFVVMTNGLTTTAPDNESFFARFKELTRGDIPVLAGGEHATMWPEDAKSYADYILAFEGDESVFPFLDALEESDPISRDSLFSQVPGLHYRDIEGKWRFNKCSGRVTAIDYRYDLSILAGAEGAGRRMRATSIPLQTTRGCRFACSFCTWISLFGKPGYRLRPPEDLVHDVTHAMEYIGTNNFIICDNLFAGDEAHMEETMGQLIRACEGKSERPRLTVCMRADQLSGGEGSLSDRQVALMARAGVSVVSFGLESTNERSLIQMRKGMTTTKYVAAAETLRRHGIAYLGTFVSGFDEDTPKDIAGIADFAEKLGLFTIQVYSRAITSGTTDFILYDRRMIPGRLHRYTNGHGAWILPSSMLPSELQEAVFEVMLRFHKGVPSRAPARRVFSTIWDRLQPHFKGLQRIEAEVLLPMGIYRHTHHGYRLDEDRLSSVWESPDKLEYYRTACTRIFLEEDALRSPSLNRQFDAAASGNFATVG